MRHVVPMPTASRRPDQRLALRHMADALLRADARRQRATAMPTAPQKPASLSTTGPQPLRLADLKWALAMRPRDKS
jgi:hypothetical protein